MQIERLEREATLVREQLESTEAGHERDKEDLQALRDRLRELELVGMRRTTSQDPVSTSQGKTLGEELEGVESSGNTRRERWVSVPRTSRIDS